MSMYPTARKEGSLSRRTARHPCTRVVLHFRVAFVLNVLQRQKGGRVAPARGPLLVHRGEEPVTRREYARLRREAGEELLPVAELAELDTEEHQDWRTGDLVVGEDGREHVSHAAWQPGEEGEGAAAAASGGRESAVGEALREAPVCGRPATTAGGAGRCLCIRRGPAVSSRCPTPGARRCAAGGSAGASCGGRWGRSTESRLEPTPLKRT